MFFKKQTVSKQKIGWGDNTKAKTEESEFGSSKQKNLRKGQRELLK